MPSNFPPGYNEDGDAATHGRETAIYQELLEVKAAFDKWADRNRSYIPVVEMSNLVDEMEIEFETLVEYLDVPL